jgi:hypothetical protein
MDIYLSIDFLHQWPIGLPRNLSHVILSGTE